MYTASWYNEACKLARRNLSVELRLKNPCRVRGARDLYRRTQSAAKRQWDKDRWRDLKSACSKKDSKKFWDIIKWDRGGVAEPPQNNIAKSE